LHGGASRGEPAMVSPTQLSVIRMIPIARRIARTGRGKLAVFRLLNSTRGWDTGHTPVDDARWAMGEIQERVGDLPLGLVGHSLGGRAALLAGGEPPVRTVVALAPWVYRSDSPDLGGRRVLIVHGSADRIAPLRRAEAVARNISATTDVGFICIRGGKHAMLSHQQQFDGYAAAFTAATLCPDLDVQAPDAVKRVLAGETMVTV
jgi:dienelactone hydrolase